MRVVITGAAGFLGIKLAQALLNRGYISNDQGQAETITKLVLFDRVTPKLSDDRLELITGDITDNATLASLITADTRVIFHLAAVVSGEAEQNFDLGMRVNLAATQALLEHCRQLPAPPKVIFASSVAVFGGELPAIIQDSTAATPQSSYGTQKAMGELLLNDYSRKGFIDARVLRFPTLVIRPGKPNAATSTFASSIIREPLQGNPAVCPVTPNTQLWVLSPRQAVRSALQAVDMSGAQLGEHRILSLPGITTSVQEMIDSLETLAGTAVVKRISFQPDPFIQRIVGSWPSSFAPKRAQRLGFEADASMTTIIRNFIEDDLEANKS